MEERQACPHWQTVGCLSDTLEKLCEADSAGSSDESSRALLKPDTPESVWLCCCPKPYEPCTAAQRSSKCDAVLHESFKGLAGSIATNRAVIEGVLRARQGFRQADPRCGKILSELDFVANPAGSAPRFAYCGREVKPKLTRAVAHPGVFCETVTWQWEELGDGDPDEFRANGCPIPSKAKYEEQGRKGGTQGGKAVPPEVAKLFT